MTEFRNIEILGVGKETGGRFGRVLIAGSGKFTGDVECDRFELPGAGKIEEGGLTVHGPLEIDGAGKVEGPVRAESLEVNGSFKTEGTCEITGDTDVNGSLKTEASCTVGGNADICGSFHVEGDLTVGGLDITGAVNVSGCLQAVDVSVDGILKAGGEVQAEHFRADGTVKIEGLLNAETVELELSGEDEIGSIGGGSVTVRRKSRSIFSFSRKRPHLLTALIEADEIDVEYTDCETVRGINVKIGPECVIDRVEYSGTFSADPTASVGSTVKV